MQLLSLSADLGFGLGLRSLDPALALLGTNAEGFAIDGPSLRAVVRSPGLNWSGNINDLLTYASPSTKWIVNKAGVLESGTALRCEYDPATGAPLGVRVEQQATNLASYSDDFTNAVWPVSTATKVGGQPAPDGSTNAVNIVMPSPVSSVWRRGISGAGKAGGNAVAFWVKSTDNWTWPFMLRNDTTGTNFAQGLINLSTGAATGAWTVEPYPDGWYRISFAQATGISAGDTISFYYGYTGGATPPVGTALRIWGADLFNVPSVSSHISTTTAAVTRAADDITLPLDAFPWNDGSGTLKLNGATVSPILNGAEDALDIAALAAAAGATHVKTLTWVPA